MTIKYICNGETVEGSEEYALRMMEQGNKVEFVPAGTEKAETEPEAPAKAEPKAKKGK